MTSSIEARLLELGLTLPAAPAPAANYVPYVRSGSQLFVSGQISADENGMITAYKLRQPDQKRQAVKALHGLNYRVIAAGDSYNDTTMLGEADHGFLFDAPANVIAEFPQFPPLHGYEALKQAIRSVSQRNIPE